MNYLFDNDYSNTLSIYGIILDNVVFLKYFELKISDIWNNLSLGLSIKKFWFGVKKISFKLNNNKTVLNHYVYYNS